MDKMKALKVKRFLAKESPVILTGAAVTGVFTTIGLTISATTEANILICEAECQKMEREMDPEATLTLKEKIKVGWKPFIPVFVSGGITIASIIAANSISTKRNLALLAINALSEKAFTEYKEEIQKVLGKNKEQKARDDIATVKLQKQELKPDAIIFSGKGESLCYDTLSGRYFMSDLETIRKAVNQANKDMLDNMVYDLNSFYDEIGLPHTELGDIMAWTPEYGLMDLSYTAAIAPDGRPCIVLNYRISPKAF